MCWNLGSQTLEGMAERVRSATCKTRARETIPVEKALRRPPALALALAPRGARSLGVEANLMDRELYKHELQRLRSDLVRRKMAKMNSPSST